MRQNAYIYLLIAAVLGAACGPQGAGEDGPAADDAEDDRFLADGKADGVFGVTEGSPEALCVLRFANELSQNDLSQKAKVGTLASRYIAEHRLGPDKVAGTPDDRRFGTLAELDAVSYVGATAFSKLLAYARASGCPAMGGMTCAAPSWRIETVSATASIPGNADWAERTTALAIARDGTMHVTFTAMRAFQGQRDYAVIYARKAPGGAWSETLLMNRATESALALTPKGEVLAAVTGAGVGTQVLRVASDGSFVRDSTLGPNLGRHPALAVGDDGRVHLTAGARAFMSGYAGAPFYSVRATNGAWTAVAINDSFGNNVPGEYMDVAADGKGGAHIVFSRDEFTSPPAHVLRYGYMAPGSTTFARSTYSNDKAWNPRIVVSPTGTPTVRSFLGLGSMALASDGKLHMTSYTRDDGRLLHHTETTMEVVDVGDSTVGRGVGLGSALVITSDGRLHITYHALHRGEVRHAVYGCP